jgi:hypothetical protein
MPVRPSYQLTQIGGEYVSTEARLRSGLNQYAGLGALNWLTLHLLLSAETKLPSTTIVQIIKP